MNSRPIRSAAYVNGCLSLSSLVGLAAAGWGHGRLFFLATLAALLAGKGIGRARQSP